MKIGSSLVLAVLSKFRNLSGCEIYLKKFTFLFYFILLLMSLRMVGNLYPTNFLWYLIPFLIYFTFFCIRMRITHPAPVDLLWKSLLLLAVSFGVGFRIYWVFFSGVQQTSDAGYYITQAFNILDGKYFIDIYKQVGPGIMTSIGLLLGGRESSTAAVFPLLVSGIIYLPLIYFVTKQLFGRTAAWLALGLTAVWPEHIFYSTFINANLYQGFFLLLGFFLFLKAEEFKRNEQLFSLVAGFCYGVAQYMRGSGLIFIAAFCIYLVFQRKFRISGYLAIGFVLATIPILYSNYSNFKVVSFSPAQNAGFSLVIGSNIATKGHYYAEFGDEVQAEVAKLPRTVDGKAPSLNAAEMNDLAKKVGFRKIMQDPLLFIKTAVSYKLPIFWGNSGGLSWAFENTVIQRSPELEARIASFSEGFHRMLLVFGLLSTGVILFLKKLPAQDGLYGFLWGCFAVSAIHMFAEIQSPYHQAIGSFYPIISSAGFAYLNQIESGLSQFWKLMVSSEAKSTLIGLWRK